MPVLKDLDNCRWEPIAEMAPEAVADELALFRQMWEYLDPEVRYWAARTNQEIVVQTRTNKAYYGELTGMKWKPEAMVFFTIVKEWNFEAGAPFLETRTMEVPIGTIAYHAFLHDKEQLEDGSVAQVTDQSLSGLTPRKLATGEEGDDDAEND